MSLSDAEHFSMMYSGSESLNLFMTNKGDLTEQGKQAFNVLKLHAADEGHVAGTEGFMDSIKKGATKTKEWLVKLIKAIRDASFFVYKSITGSFKILFAGGENKANMKYLKQSMSAVTDKALTKVDDLLDSQYVTLYDEYLPGKNVEKQLKDCKDLLVKAAQNFEGDKTDGWRETSNSLSKVCEKLASISGLVSQIKLDDAKRQEQVKLINALKDVAITSEAIKTSFERHNERIKREFSTIIYV